MPELPEVETVRRQLAGDLVGAHVTWVRTRDEPRWREPRSAVGAQVTGLRRRGKYLLADLAGGEVDPTRPRELIIHLGMTGQLQLLDADQAAEERLTESASPPGNPPAAPHVPVALGLDGGRVLRLRDVRRFGRVSLREPGDHAGLATLAALGPEPLGGEFDPAVFAAEMGRPGASVKARLLSQKPVAGLGNIYADEACWRARVHPGARRLTRPAALRLHAAIIESLQAGLDLGGTTFRDYRDGEGRAGAGAQALQAYGRAGLPCGRCATPLVGLRLAGRATVLCPRCQPRPRR